MKFMLTSEHCSSRPSKLHSAHRKGAPQGGPDSQALSCPAQPAQPAQPGSFLNGAKTEPAVANIEQGGKVIHTKVATDNSETNSTFAQHVLSLMYEVVVLACSHCQCHAR
jgi:hypothetical protein